MTTHFVSAVTAAFGNFSVTLTCRDCGEQDVGMPADYVNKLARMFQDIKVSEDLNQEFKEAHRNNNEGLAGQ